MFFLRLIRKFLSVVAVLLIALVFTLFLLTAAAFTMNTLQPYRSATINSDSMEPNYPKNTMILYNKHPSEHYERGEAVMYHMPRFAYGTEEEAQLLGPEMFISRVVGLPGENISFRNGAVYINEGKLEESYLSPGTVTDPKSEKTRWQLRENEYFLLGDNRMYATDSRGYGSVPKENIIGKVVRIVERPE